MTRAARNRWAECDCTEHLHHVATARCSLRPPSSASGCLARSTRSLHNLCRSHASLLPGLADFDASFDRWTAKGAWHCLHVKPIHHCAWFSVVIFCGLHCASALSYHRQRCAVCSKEHWSGVLQPSNVRPEMNSEGDGNRVCFPHGISSHERTSCPHCRGTTLRNTRKSRSCEER